MRTALVEALTSEAQQGMEDESTDGAGDQADHENVDAVQEICGRASRAHQVDHHVDFRREESERVLHVPDQVPFCDTDLVQKAPEEVAAEEPEAQRQRDEPENARSARGYCCVERG